MKRWAVFLFAMSLPAAAQSADALYQQACGPRDAKFAAQQVKGQQPRVTPEPGKALVYFIHEETTPNFQTKIGVDGAWVGALQHDSYMFASVAPGEHHACAFTLNRNHPKPELVHFTVQAGEVYYYLVRAFDAGGYGFYDMEFSQVDRDEALYLIATDPQSVAKPKP